MPRFRSFLSLCLLAASVATPTQAAPRAAPTLVPPSVAAAIVASGLTQDSFGMFVQAVDGERPVVRLNDERPYTMASTTKVVTSLAALDLLGPYYRWRTSAYAMGPIVAADGARRAGGGGVVCGV